MAHSHYVMDLYYAAADGSDNLQREVMRIEAANDEEALEEAVRINGWRQPARYEVRAMTKSARTGHRVVFASPLAEPAKADADEAAAGQINI